MLIVEALKIQIYPNLKVGGHVCMPIGSMHSAFDFGLDSLTYFWETGFVCVQCKYAYNLSCLQRDDTVFVTAFPAVLTTMTTRFPGT